MRRTLDTEWLELRLPVTEAFGAKCLNMHAEYGNVRPSRGIFTFVGAIYMHLIEVERLRDVNKRIIESSNNTVLPLPVGAAKAQSFTRWGG